MNAASVSGQDRRSDVAELLLHVAQTLERSAQLADQHAQRERSKGRPDEERIELERAKQARAAAQRGRAFASRLQD